MVNSLKTAAIASGRVDFFTTGKGVLCAADNADDGVFLPRRRALLCEVSATRRPQSGQESTWSTSVASRR